MAAVSKMEFAVRKTGTYVPENENARVPISRMSNSELLRFGVTAKFRYSQSASPDDPDLAAHLIEARAEWNRRHPGLPLRDSF
jgi:hypothetical protein